MVAILDEKPLDPNPELLRRLSLRATEIATYHFFKAMPPSPLFHYTTENGLKGILKSNSLRAKNIFKFQDRHEYWYGMSLFYRALVSRSCKGEEKFFFDQLIKDFPNQGTELVALTQGILSHQTFVSCFSRKGDDLSQWEKFGAFAIEFDASIVSALLVEGQRQVWHSPVCYEEELKRTQFLAMMDEFGNLAVSESLMGRMIEGEPAATILAQHAIATAVVNSCFLKNQCFSSENEWRFIYSDLGVEDYRVPESAQVKGFVEMRPKDEKMLPITTIWCGPSAHLSDNIKLAKRLRSRYGFRHVKVMKAELTH